MPLTFTAGTSTGSPVPTTGTRVIIGDFDRDGDIDFFGQISNIADPFRFYANDGSGTFTAIDQPSGPFGDENFTFTPTAAGVSDNWRVYDFTGDGHVDLWIIRNDNTDRFYRNVSAGDFDEQSAAGFPGGTGNSRFLIADFNGDGAADVLYQTGGSGSTFEYALNDGSGAFTIQAQASSPFSGLTLPDLVVGGSYFAADFDGDGDIDLWRSANNTSGSFFRNNGSSFSSESAADFPVAQVGQRAVVGDFDGDGDADILFQAGADGTTYQYARSDGGGNFTVFTQANSPFAGATLPSFGTLNLRAADFNGDGRLDLWTSNGTTGQILYNGGAPPVLQSSTPADNGTGVAVNANIVLTFDQSVVKGTGNIRIYRASDDALFETIAVTSGIVSGSGTTWTINPTGTFADGTAYYVQIDATAFVDTTGGTYAGIDDETTLNFTTIAAGGTANDDSPTTAENNTLSANVSTNDTGFTAVTQVNGNAGNVGGQITLASGALLTMLSTGAYSYNPNGAFNSLAAVGSGASNTSTTDSFTYTINGGDTATVTITITGVDSNGDVMQGTVGNDTITAGIGNDIVNGGDGDDTLSGAAGNDILNGQTANDVLNGGIGADKLYGLEGQDTLNGGDGADFMEGGADNDTLNGGADNDSLNGGSGGDAMTGGTGNDVYFVDNSNDTTVELAGEGYDIVRTALTWTLADNIEGLELQGSGNANGTGNGEANNLQGNDGDNFLLGLGGVDTINGGNGNDVIIGGEGNDLLRGGAGADDFRVAHAFGSTLEIDTVYDFVGGVDRVDVSQLDPIAGGLDNAFTIGAFNGTAGRMSVAYDGSTWTVVRLDMNGDNKVDYQMRIAGDVSGSTANWLL